MCGVCAVCRSVTDVSKGSEHHGRSLRKTQLLQGQRPKRIFLKARLNLNVFEGSLEIKLPTIWTEEKQRWEDSEKRREEKRREEERRSKKRKSQKKEDPGARKGRKVAKHTVFFFQ